MKLRAILAFALLASLAELACSLSDRTPGYCGSDLDCPSGTRCKLDSPKKNSCVPKTDAAADGPDAAAPDASTDTDARDSHIEMTPADVPCAAGACSVAAPICDLISKMCRGCTGGAECSVLNAATPTCVGGKCVACGASTDCKIAGQPICDTTSNSCRACGSGTECATRDPAVPICDASGACVECSTSSDCKTGAAPICDPATHSCSKCSTDTQCQSRDSTKPACSPTGICVACTDGKKHCPTTAPICDSNACRTCTKDAECSGAYGADPGLCVGGQCATNGQVIYLQNTNSCSPSTRGDGSVASPFCFPGDAAAALSSQKTIILVRGPRSVEALSLGFGGGPVVIAGQNGAGFATVTGMPPLVSITAGDVTLRDLNISSGPGAGVAATGGTLRMTRCMVLNNSDTGITTKNAAFDITNTVVAGNMGGLAVSLGTYSGTGPKRFAFNTIVNNTGTGVFCGQAYSVGSLLVNGNGTSFVGMCTTDATTSTAAPSFDGARPYHLTSTSPCVNMGGTTNVPPDDIDGDVRPQGPAADCGADEYVP